MASSVAPTAPVVLVLHPGAGAALQAGPKGPIPSVPAAGHSRIPCCPGICLSGGLFALWNICCLSRCLFALWGCLHPVLAVLGYLSPSGAVCFAVTFGSVGEPGDKVSPNSSSTAMPIDPGTAQPRSWHAVLPLPRPRRVTPRLQQWVAVPPLPAQEFSSPLALFQSNPSLKKGKALAWLLSHDSPGKYFRDRYPEIPVAGLTGPGWANGA